MTLRRLMHESRSLIHGTFGWKCGADRSGNQADRPERGRGVDPAVAQRRSEAMRHFFPKLAIWLTNRIHFSRMPEIERYLSQASDLVDLEHRIAKIERSAGWH